MVIIRVLLSLLTVGCVGAAFLFLFYLAFLIYHENKKSEIKDDEE